MPFLGLGWFLVVMSILENKQFKTVLDNLISELSKEYIESFKIGVTRDLNERQNSSYYNGYQLFRLANIESGRVKNIEYETILYFKDSSKSSGPSVAPTDEYVYL